jgi:hypothetical protein
MAVTNKEELIKLNALLEEENLKLKEQLNDFNAIKKEFEANRKLKDDVILNEFNLKKEKDKLLLLMEENKKAALAKEATLNKDIEALKGELNRLATLFDEYIVAFKDQIQTFDVFQRNTKNAEKFLQSKIDTFNKREDSKK